MGLVEIKTFKELLTFLPLLVKTYKNVDGHWEQGLSEAAFVAKVTNYFGQKGSYYYGLQRDGELLYFMAFVSLEDNVTEFWLLYVNRAQYKYTKNLVKAALSEQRRLGFSRINFTTTRMTRSYDRWVSGFGAKKHSINYTIN